MNDAESSRARSGPRGNPKNPQCPRARLILHGRRASNEEVRAAVAATRKRGRELEVRVTWEEGDATTLTREAVAAGVEMIIAGGGDGTVREIVDTLATKSSPADGSASDRSNGRQAGGDTAPRLAILPLGTGNDFATAAGIPQDPLEALELAFEGVATPVDVGQVNDESFLNVATAGFATEITVETPDELKDLLGAAAYLLSGVRRFSTVGAVEMEVRGPSFEYRGPVLGLAIGNGRTAGGGYQVCPEALLDDGLLQLSLVPEVEGSTLEVALGAFLGRPTERVLQVMTRRQLPWVELRSEQAFHVNLDGEPLEGNHFRFETASQALQLQLPQSCPLLSRNHEAVEGDK